MDLVRSEWKKLQYSFPQSGWQLMTRDLGRGSLGLCDSRERTVILNERIIVEGLEDEVVDTVRHEYAHILTHMHQPHILMRAHGPEWKYWAQRVGARTSARVNVSENPLLARALGLLDREPTHVVILDNPYYIVKVFYRKPSKEFFRRLPSSYLEGAREQTLGKLRVVPFSDIKHLVEKSK